MSHGSDVAAAAVPAVPSAPMSEETTRATAATADQSAFLKDRSRKRKLTVNQLRAGDGVGEPAAGVLALTGGNRRAGDAVAITMGFL
jgi:hypothetical protein